MKKALANMWWIILSAVIALVVLIVLMVIFTEKTGILETGLSSCESKGGVCVPALEGEKVSCPANTLTSPIFECGSGKKCCLGTPKVCKNDDDCEDKQICYDEYCYKE